MKPSFWKDFFPVWMMMDGWFAAIMFIVATLLWSIQPAFFTVLLMALTGAVCFEFGYASGRIDEENGVGLNEKAVD